MMAKRIHDTATVDPAAQLGPLVEVWGYATVGPNAVINGPVTIRDNCFIDNVTIDTRETITFFGDGYIDSDDDWFLTEPDGGGFVWYVFTSVRTKPNGQPYWLAGSNCVWDVEVADHPHPWHLNKEERGLPNWLPAEVAADGHHENRNAHMGIVAAECARRNGEQL